MKKKDSEAKQKVKSDTAGTATLIPPLIPPDGGWGWLVVVCNCIVMMVVPTTLSAYGVLVPELSRIFDSTIAGVSWVPAIAGTIWNVLTPVATAWLTIYSHRRLALTGIFLVFLGLALSSVASSMMVLYLTYGVIVGVGAGLGSGMGVLIVQEYFQVNRATANGITMAGGSIGQMTIPLILQLLIDNFGLRGALLLHSGIVLQGVVAACIFQPSRWHYKRRPVEAEPLNPLPLHTPQRHEEARERSQSLTFPNHHTGLRKQPISKLAVAIPKNVHDNSTSSPVSSPTKNVAQLLIARQDFKQRSLSVSEDHHHRPPHLDEHFKVSAAALDYVGSISSMIGSVTSIASIPQLVPPTPEQAEFSKTYFARHKLSLREMQAMLKKRPAAPECSWYLQFFPRFPTARAIFDFSLMRSPFFVLASFGSAIGRLIYQEINVLVPPYAQELGLSATAGASLITILAAADTLARLVVPVISDKLSDKISRITIYALEFAVTAVACLGMAFTTSFEGLAACCVLYGIGFGGITGLSVVVLVEYLGLEKLAASFGLSIFLSCVVILPGIPLVGYIQVATKSYPVCFIVISVLSVLCTILWAIIPTVTRCCDSRNNRKTPNPT